MKDPDPNKSRSDPPHCFSVPHHSLHCGHCVKVHMNAQERSVHPSHPLFLSSPVGVRQDFLGHDSFLLQNAGFPAGH